MTHNRDSCLNMTAVLPTVSGHGFIRNLQHADCLSPRQAWRAQQLVCVKANWHAIQDENPCGFCVLRPADAISCRLKHFMLVYMLVRCNHTSVTQTHAPLIIQYRALAASMAQTIPSRVLYVKLLTVPVFTSGRCCCY